MNLNRRLIESVALIQATAIGALATTVGDGLYVSMKGYRKATIVIDVTNSTTVTGGIVTLKQAKNVANNPVTEKALAFSTVAANLDVAAGQAPAALVDTAVTSNTFTTDTTNSKRLRYVIEIDSEDLDVANEFDCFRVDVASMANANGQVSYILWGGRYGASADPTID